MKKLLAMMMSAFLLAGCSNQYVQEALEYLKPTAAPVSTADSNNQSTKQEDEKESKTESTPDPNVPSPNPDPWMGADGGVPSNAIGKLTVKRDGMEIHQYGGIASQVDMTADAGDQFYVSQIYMDGSGYRWYCCGVDMWLLVTNMEDIDYEPIEEEPTPTPSNSSSYSYSDYNG